MPVSGYAEEVVSDNEPQFISNAYELMRKNGIKHALSSCQAKTAILSVKGNNFAMACFVPSVLILFFCK